MAAALLSARSYLSRLWHETNEIFTSPYVTRDTTGLAEQTSLDLVGQAREIVSKLARLRHGIYDQARTYPHPVAWFQQRSATRMTIRETNTQTGTKPKMKLRTSPVQDKVLTFRSSLSSGQCEGRRGACLLRIEATSPSPTNPKVLLLASTRSMQIPSSQPTPLRRDRLVQTV